MDMSTVRRPRNSQAYHEVKILSRDTMGILVRGDTEGQDDV